MVVESSVEAVELAFSTAVDSPSQAAASQGWPTSAAVAVAPVVLAPVVSPVMVLAVSRAVAVGLHAVESVEAAFAVVAEAALAVVAVVLAASAASVAAAVAVLASSDPFLAAFV